MYLVGTDGGLLQNAVTISDGDGIQESNEFLVLAPGDRVELIFDFSKLQDGDAVKLLNVGPKFEPFGGVEDIADPATENDAVGNIMQFAVNTAIKPFDATIQDGTVLVKNYVNLALDSDHNGIADAAGNNVRELGLFEGIDEFDRVTPMLGTANPGKLHSDNMHPDGKFGPLAWDAPTTEMPLLGSTEQWDIFNFTADSHPIHLHLTQFQVVKKQQIYFEDKDDNGVPDDRGDGISYKSVTNFQDQDGDGVPDQVNYSIADIWIGAVVNLRPEETGWQDTAWVDPNQMMSIVATFDKPGAYVWHCHILSHEDNEMMRPFIVVEDEPTGVVGIASNAEVMMARGHGDPGLLM